MIHTSVLILLNPITSGTSVSTFIGQILPLSLVASTLRRFMALICSIEMGAAQATTNVSTTASTTAVASSGLPVWTSGVGAKTTGGALVAVAAGFAAILQII